MIDIVVGDTFLVAECFRKFSNFLNNKSTTLKSEITYDIFSPKISPLGNNDVKISNM